jgi:hypothetical protein
MRQLATLEVEVLQRQVQAGQPDPISLAPATLLGQRPVPQVGQEFRPIQGNCRLAGGLVLGSPAPTLPQQVATCRQLVVVATGRRLLPGQRPLLAAVLACQEIMASTRLPTAHCLGAAAVVAVARSPATLAQGETVDSLVGLAEAVVLLWTAWAIVAQGAQVEAALRW